MTGNAYGPHPGGSAPEGHMASLRRYYGVPARRGGRLLFTGLKFPVAGRIISARDHKLWIRTDDGRRFGPLHPTWEVEYLDA